MTTRTIVTSQPDVACDVCARRLLRGENHDVFLVAGRRRTVCELCAPRAVHEGWQRETEQSSLTLPPMRPRRGRGLVQRLLRGAGVAEGQNGRGSSRAQAESGEGSRRASPYDMLNEDDSSQEGASTATAAGSTLGQAAHPEHSAEQGGAEESIVRAPLAPGTAYLEEAVVVFNASEFPRRVAGVARSLGPPMVSVRSAEHLSSVVRIAVAWELSWYRYEVDLSEDDVAARSRGQGTELHELEREELEVNASADAGGALRLEQP